MEFSKIHPQDEQWYARGVDVWLLRSNLALSYEDRVEQHQNTLDCIAELKQLGSAHRAKPARPSQISHQQPS